MHTQRYDLRVPLARAADTPRRLPKIPSLAVLVGSLSFRKPRKADVEIPSEPAIPADCPLRHASLSCLCRFLAEPCRPANSRPAGGHPAIAAAPRNPRLVQLQIRRSLCERPALCTAWFCQSAFVSKKVMVAGRSIWPAIFRLHGVGPAPVSSQRVCKSTRSCNKHVRRPSGRPARVRVLKNLKARNLSAADPRKSVEARN